MRALHIPRLALAAGLLLTLGCGRDDDVPDPAPPPPAAPEALRVTSVDVGKSLTADKAVANPTDDFMPRDTVFVSVATEGAASSATLVARFTFQDGQLVDESTRTIAPTGQARTEFHVFKPSGWPEGKYKVEVTLNGALAGSKDFEVKRG
jgi:hypothetical protein